jgi:hypothetical protein
MPPTPEHVPRVGVPHNAPLRFVDYDRAKPNQCPEYYRTVMYNPHAIIPPKATDDIGVDHPGFIDTQFVQRIHPQYFQKLSPSALPGGPETTTPSSPQPANRAWPTGRAGTKKTR